MGKVFRTHNCKVTVVTCEGVRNVKGGSPVWCESAGPGLSGSKGQRVCVLYMCMCLHDKNSGTEHWNEWWFLHLHLKSPENTCSMQICANTQTPLWLRLVLNTAEDKEAKTYISFNYNISKSRFSWTDDLRRHREEDFGLGVVVIHVAFFLVKVNSVYISYIPGCNFSRNINM